MKDGALFPKLLGAAFDRMDGPLQAVHRGVAEEYQGMATVQRGRGMLAALACWMARLPGNMSDAPVRVRIEVVGPGERWTRWFGISAAMQSQLQSSQGFLRERLGPSVTDFKLSVRSGVLHWEAVRFWVFGVPMPRKAFDMQAWVSAAGELYRFEIAARMALVGMLIRYEGELHVG